MSISTTNNSLKPRNLEMLALLFSHFCWEIKHTRDIMDRQNQEALDKGPPPTEKLEVLLHEANAQTLHTEVCCHWQYSLHLYNASLIPSPPLPLTKLPRKGWSGIFGPIPCFLPSQIILANQIDAWPHIYQNHAQNS